MLPSQESVRRASSKEHEAGQRSFEAGRGSALLGRAAASEPAVSGITRWAALTAKAPD